MSLQHIQKNSPRLLPKPAKFEKNPPNGYRVIRKTKCRAGGAGGAAGAGGAGGARSSPIHKQASLTGRLIIPSHQTETKLEDRLQIKDNVFAQQNQSIPKKDIKVSAKVLRKCSAYSLILLWQSLHSLLDIEQSQKWHILIYGHLYVRHVIQINDMYLTVVITHVSKVCREKTIVYIFGWMIVIEKMSFCWKSYSS